jgi:predicted transposase/invertase (TIGR01784 family)
MGDEGETMRRDAIFYQIFQRFPGLLFELVNDPPPEAERYRFESVEVKEPNFRIDGVFLPPDDGSAKTVFFAEIQFQKDDDLYHRLIAESMLFLYRNRSLYDDWCAVVIFPSRSLEPENTRMHRGFLNSDQVQRIYLDELGDPNEQSLGISLMQLTLASEAGMPTQARALMERVQQSEISILSKTEIIEVITTIAVYKLSTLSREEVEMMLGRTFEESRLYRELTEVGRQEGAVEIALRLLTRRFGPLSDFLQTQIRRLSSAQLTDLSEALLDFSSLEDLTMWLRNYSPSESTPSPSDPT